MRLFDEPLLGAWVVALSAVPVLVAAARGARVGAGIVLRRVASVAIAWATAVTVTRLVFEAGGYHPFGLITPIVFGLLSGAVMWKVVRVIVLRDRVDRPASTSGRSDGAGQSEGTALVEGSRTPAALLGSAIGAGVGFCGMAAVWFALSLVEVATDASLPRESRSARKAQADPSEPSPTDTAHAPAAGTLLSWSRGVVRTANRGFVQHLPLVGEYGSEIEGLVTILNASSDERERLVSEYDLGPFRDLPAYRRIVDDAEFWRDVIRIRDGEVWALYDLQTHPHVIEFMRDAEVRDAISTLRPSRMARRLEQRESVP